MKKILNFISILAATMTMSSCVRNIGPIVLNTITGNTPVITASLGLMRDKDDESEYTVLVLNDEDNESEITILSKDEFFNETECCDYPLGPSEIILKRAEETTHPSCRLNATLNVQPQILDNRQKISFHLKIIKDNNQEQLKLIHFSFPFGKMDPDIQSWDLGEEYSYDFTLNVSNNTIILDISDGEIK